MDDWSDNNNEETAGHSDAEEKIKDIQGVRDEDDSE